MTLVWFCPPGNSALSAMEGVYEVADETETRYTLEVELEGHTAHNPSIVYISAVKEHCAVVE